MTDQTRPIESLNTFIAAQLTRVITRSIFEANNLGIELGPGFIDVCLNNGNHMLRASLYIEKENDDT